MDLKLEEYSRSYYLCVSASLRETCSPVALAIIALLILASPLVADEAAFGPTPPDPAKVVGSDQCAKCHQQEVDAWLRTTHFATFDALHRTPEAKAIAERLGLRSIKRNETCTKCHYTQQEQGGRLRVIAGVACESCHGAAANWLASHADYGGANGTKDMESPEHRETRVRESIARGMNNPHNVYLIARECYNCHTVPDESLVNVGGHAAGSNDFEFVAWSQGNVRHNFLRTGGTVNAQSTPAELRVMYVVGVMTDLEYSLRAVAAATAKAPYGVASAERAVRMKRKLLEIQGLVHDPLIETAVAAVSTVELRLNNRTAILTAANEIGKTALKFAEDANGRELSAVDPLLPKPSSYKN
jgi:hypothetical protein